MANSWDTYYSLTKLGPITGTRANISSIQAFCDHEAAPRYQSEMLCWRLILDVYVWYTTVMTTVCHATKCGSPADIGHDAPPFISLAVSTDASQRVSSLNTSLLL